jgi:hypothetical protein
LARNIAIGEFLARYETTWAEGKVIEQKIEEAERQFLVNFISLIDDAVTGELMFEPQAVSVQNIKEVRILVQSPSNSISSPIMMRTCSGRDILFEIDGRYSFERRTL